MVSSYGYGLDKFLVLVILVVDDQWQVGFGHTHSPQFNSA
jgi:hypothetical protein